VIKRRGYQVPIGGYYFPLDYLLEIHCLDGQSPELQKDLALLGAHMPYRQAKEVYARFRNNAPSHVTFQKCTNQLGDKAKQVEVRCLKKNKNVPHLTFQADGGRINTLDGGWKETKTAIIENSSDLIQMTMITDHEEFMSEYCSVIEKQNYDKYPVIKALISDGAKWIGDDFSKFYPKIIQILDYYHLKEHFFDTAKILFGELNTAQNKAWVDQHVEFCFQNKIAELILKLQNQMQEQNDEMNKESLRKLLDYIKNNKHRITYGKFKELGLPIGSGKVEATVKKSTNSRIKSGSIKWRLRNAQSVLTLRSTIFNGQFQQIKFA
jgi:hypothetical protein